MTGGAASTTFYDVVTRYRVENLADGPLSRFHGATRSAGAGARDLRTELRGLGSTLGSTARLFAPIAGGMTAVGIAGAALVKTFRNLNEGANAANSMAAQINLAANFSPDPVLNFNRSLVASKGLIRDLTRDAAKLPGELSEFMDVARMISGATFGAGGNLQTIRGLTARVALAAPAAGQTSRDAGNQAMRILYGTASVGDNPLFAMLRGAPGSGMRDTAQFNALPAAERLRVFNAELAKLTDNPMFRKQIIRTFDTQLGTLSDNLFGAQGVLGQLGRNAFDDFLNGLVRLNEWIDTNKGTWIRNINVLTGIGAQPLGLNRAQLDAFMGPTDIPGRQTNRGLIDRMEGFQKDQAHTGAVNRRATNMLRKIMVGEGLPPETIEMLAGLGGGQEFMAQKKYRDMWPGLVDAAERQLAFAQKSASDEDHAGSKFSAKDLSKPTITQHFTIKLDLKSDDAPDAVAVKISRALEKAGRHPVTSRRALQATSGASVLNP